MSESIQRAIEHFFPETGSFTLLPIKSGLINHTWKLTFDSSSFVLQQVNKDVFTDPELIHGNLDLLRTYLARTVKDVHLVLPLSDQDDRSLFFDGESYYRIFPWVEDSVTVSVVNSPEQAYEAARQFGRFTAAFHGFDHGLLKTVLPDFHNLRLRFDQFHHALKSGNPERIESSKEIIDQLLQKNRLVDIHDRMVASEQFRVRVMHHDAKISNVLFDRNDKGICVIDLDTVMAGRIFSDWGDMVRTYVCPVSEEETELDRITIRKEYLEAIENAYLEELGDVMTEPEKKSLRISGMILIYMQALRFMTDHLHNDVYYGAAYPGHNFNRAVNQFMLLTALENSGDSTEWL